MGQSTGAGTDKRLGVLVNGFGSVFLDEPYALWQSAVPKTRSWPPCRRFARSNNGVELRMPRACDGGCAVFHSMVSPEARLMPVSKAAIHAQAGGEMAPFAVANQAA